MPEQRQTETASMCPACGSPIPALPLTGNDGALLAHTCRCGRTSQPGAEVEQGAILTVLPDAAMESLCSAFVEANRAEFLDADFDVPILRAIEALVRQAWHEGYGAGSSARHGRLVRPARAAPDQPLRSDHSARLDGWCVMAVCEPCWNEAFRQSRLVGGSQVDHYQRLIEVIDGHPHDKPENDDDQS